MNFSKPIYWRQGIFLQPQHFQYNDAYQAQAIARVLKVSRNHMGALAAIKFSNDRLQSGYLSCGELKGFMPDGQWVDIRLNARLPDVDVRKKLTVDGVYSVVVGLPKFTSGDPAVASNGLDGRFETVGYSEELPDLYEDTPDLEIDRLWLRLRFLIGEEVDAAQDMETIPVARLVVEAGVISFDETYAPPCLNIDAHPSLSNRVHLLIDAIQSRETRMSEMSRPWRLDGEPLDPALLRDRMVLAELAQCLTQVDHRIRAESAPADLFECFIVMSRRLSALGGVSCPDLPVWDHEDPYRSFDRVSEIVLALLEQLRSGPDSLAVFKARDGWLEAQVPAAARVGFHTAYVVLQKVGEAQLLQASPAKLASLTRIETVVSRALPGIGLERLERIPYGLGDHAETSVWRIDTSDPLWKEASASGTICLHWLGLPATMRALLVYFRS